MPSPHVDTVSQKVHASALLLTRIRGEYLEMPGLRLTPAQARLLWNLDAGECQRLLDELVSARFLVRTPDGAYRRTI